MSGIVGIINLDGEPIDPHLLRRMTDRDVLTQKLGIAPLLQ